jgi:hypothetical protein
MPDRTQEPSRSTPRIVFEWKDIHSTEVNFYVSPLCDPGQFAAAFAILKAITELAHAPIAINTLDAIGRAGIQLPQNVH